MHDAILIGSEMLGSPDETLGRLLMGNFLRIMGDRDSVPRYIILWHSGARLAVEDSESSDYLKHLASKGAEIIICRTCVEYYDIEDRVAVGTIDGMARIQDILLNNTVLTI